MAEHLILGGREQGYKLLIGHPELPGRFLAVRSERLLDDQDELGLDLPGGCQEVDESVGDCVLRELAEEVPGQRVDPGLAVQLGVQIIRRVGKPSVVRHILRVPALNVVERPGVFWPTYAEATYMGMDPYLEGFIARCALGEVYHVGWAEALRSCATGV